MLNVLETYSFVLSVFVLGYKFAGSAQISLHGIYWFIRCVIRLILFISLVEEVLIMINCRALLAITMDIYMKVVIIAVGMEKGLMNPQKFKS